MSGTLVGIARYLLNGLVCLALKTYANEMLWSTYIAMKMIAKLKIICKT